MLEHTVGIEPTNNGFADRSITTLARVHLLPMSNDTSNNKHVR